VEDSRRKEVAKRERKWRRRSGFGKREMRNLLGKKRKRKVRTDG